MSYVKKSYCFKNDKMRVFCGHITKETALKLGFDKVNLSIFDKSGHGRSETRYFFAPFAEMRKFN